jgi:hypothetical protein
MTAVISLNATPAQLSSQFTIAPKLPTAIFSTRMKAGSTSSCSSTSVSGGSVVSAAIGCASNSAYGSTSALSQMNQDLLNAQAQNEAALQRQLQSGGSTSSSGGTAGLNADQAQAQAEMRDLIQLQIAMQRENQHFTALSNILKTRHETLKTIIGNIR